MYDMKPYLKRIDEVIKKGPYKDTWESLSQYQAPDWYQKKKFGIFIHWGVYSVPAFGSEWYSRNMYIQGSPEYEHHIKTYGKHSEFGYKDFIPMFKAEKFDPDAWASLFEEAGAQYVVPVAEHHDGFQMYKSEISHWNAYEMGPKRDVLGELGRSCNQKGMRMGASTHRIEHWFFMSHGKEFESDIKEPMERGDFYWPAMKEADLQDINSEPTPTKEFLEDYVFPCVQADALYEDYMLGTAFARPPIAKRIAEIAIAEGADAICHGCTGKGNDQVRFELAIKAFAPDITIIAPWREWGIKSREEEIEYAEAHNVPLKISRETNYSKDKNIWHLSHEGLDLEDPKNEPQYNKPGFLEMGVSPEMAPDKPTYVTLHFEKGIATAIDGKEMGAVEKIFIS